MAGQPRHDKKKCEALTRKGKPCRIPAYGGKFCINHARIAQGLPGNKRPKEAPRKSGTYKPDYYSTPEWAKFRDDFVWFNPECYVCGQTHRQRTAHHFRYGNQGSVNEWGDVVTVCHSPCHEVITALHRGKMASLGTAHIRARELLASVLDVDTQPPNIRVTTVEDKGWYWEPARFPPDVAKELDEQYVAACAA